VGSRHGAPGNSRKTADADSTGAIACRANGSAGPTRGASSEVGPLTVHRPCVRAVLSGNQEHTAIEYQETDMTTATELGQTGLQGWREKVADGISRPVAKRASLEEDQVRAVIGAAFFILAVIYVVKTISAATRQAR
jgi:hypothetical protein